MYSSRAVLRIDCSTVAGRLMRLRFLRLVPCCARNPPLAVYWPTCSGRSASSKSRSVFKTVYMKVSVGLSGKPTGSWLICLERTC
jgi:hypothetical protein